MRNFEFYAVDSKHPLLRSYALRGVVDARGSYSPERLLKAQHNVYKDWLDTMKTYLKSFECSFYEWMLREADMSFVVKDGDLVKHKGRYCVVRRKLDPTWESTWCVMCGSVREAMRPKPLKSLHLEHPDGSVRSLNAEDEGLEPADIPPEVFALACGRARECPMLKEGGDA